MKLPNSLIFAVALAVIQSAESLPSDPADYAAWESGMLESVRNQTTRPPEEAIPKLGRWIYQLSLRNHREKGARPVFTQARNTLLAIPGHAEFYSNRIREARSLLDETERGSPEYGPRQGDLRNEQRYGFGALRHLPSAETVRVLGEFLYDEKGLGDAVGEENLLEQPNSAWAAVALTDLPLVFKPIEKKADEVQIEDVEPWKLWYEQVKAGNRTFQFEGDPAHYNLQGPVTKAIEPGSLARSRKEGPADGSSRVAAEEPSRFPVALLAAACAVLGVAVWFVIGAKKRRKA